MFKSIKAFIEYNKQHRQLDKMMNRGRSFNILKTKETTMLDVELSEIAEKCDGVLVIDNNCLRYQLEVTDNEYQEWKIDRQTGQLKVGGIRIYSQDPTEGRFKVGDTFYQMRGKADYLNTDGYKYRIHAIIQGKEDDPEQDQIVKAYYGKNKQYWHYECEDVFLFDIGLDSGRYIIAKSKQEAIAKGIK